MSVVLEGGLRQGLDLDRHAWWLVLAGLAAMYVPTYAGLARGAWTQNEHAHGPIVLILTLWLVWANRKVLAWRSGSAAPLAGALMFGTGLLVYLAGRSQGVEFLEVASHVPLLSGLVLLGWGWATLRLLAFPMFLLLFLIPIPVFMLDAVSLPLKELVIHVVQGLFNGSAYEFTRDDVLLQMGTERLPVAQAASGLDCLPGLAALGVLYVYFTRPSTPARSFILLCAMLPIAIIAGIAHAAAMIVVSHHFGAGSGTIVLNAFAGMLLFIAALLMLLGLDCLLRVMGEPDAEERT